jgi:Domain of unknown function (DUF5060)/Putative collagen-binding domain of a collagenase
MTRTSRLAACLLVLVALFLGIPAAGHAVPRFDTAEVVLRADRRFNGLSGRPNPFTDVQLSAQVTSPSGKSYTVPGFFDGDGRTGARGNVFKVRIYLDEIGTWSWRTTSNNAGLHARRGTLSCSGTLAGAFGKGPLVENPAFPQSFMHQFGRPVYALGKFLDVDAPAPIKYSHTLFSEKLTEANRQAMLDRHLGMGLNKMAVYLANRGDYAGVSTTPWVGTAGANDKLRFDLTRWRMFERWVVRMRDAGMSAQLWFFADDSGLGDLPDADRQRLIRYAMARLSGYANTWFGLILEWQEGWTPAEVAATANYLQSQNPWARLVSVMGQPGDFAYPTAPWADYMQIQVGNSATPAQVHAMTVKNRGFAAKPLMSEEFALGAENLVNRQKAWTAFVSGAAGSGTGAFLKPLSQFAARVPFHRMRPLDALVTAGSAYALARAGRAYVFYLPNGGTVSVDLRAAAGTLTVEWYDPRTGATRTAPATTGGGTRTFTAPASGDWVLYVRK